VAEDNTDKRQQRAMKVCQQTEDQWRDNGGCLTASKERIQNTEQWCARRRDYCSRSSSGRGPPPMCDISFLQGCRECAALLGEERKQIAVERGPADD